MRIWTATSFNDYEQALRFLRMRDIQLDHTSDLRVFMQYGADGELVAVVAYAGWLARTCQMYVAGDAKRWVNKRLLWAAFDFPFNRADLAEVFACIRAGNEQSMHFVEHLGFRLRYSIPEGWAHGEALNVFSMRSYECPWLRLGAQFHEHRAAA